MHPAPSIIIFTVLSGLGFGMLAYLGFSLDAPTGWAAFWFFLIAYALAVGGLVSSTFHLGHPERAVKAFSQWRSSWLSREGVLAVATLVVMGLYAFLLVFFGTQVSTLGFLGGGLALATVYATSMIYAQMKTVPRWNHWSAPAMFLGFAIAGGALLTGKVSWAIWLLPLLGILQFIGWMDQDKREKEAASTIATATGLGTIGSVRAFEAPHTGENYLTQEMVFRVGRKHLNTLKALAIFLFALLPFVLLLLPFNHFFGLLAVLSHLAGVMVQRWVFFAEAKHVVSHYYGR